MRAVSQQTAASRGSQVALFLESVKKMKHILTLCLSSALDGVPFSLHPKFDVSAKENGTQLSSQLNNIRIKSIQDIEMSTTTHLPLKKLPQRNPSLLLRSGFCTQIISHTSSSEQNLISTSCFPPHHDQLRTHRVVGGGRSPHTGIGGNPISCSRHHAASNTLIQQNLTLF
ncbi:hypothetical protein WMY93_006541 [Mugilogobius chulae]|uniref:UMA domain-containing protein n=1 Tax=Mugilogobius chulae TaxID=88201 RepID=A0AAW0PWN0_9GOBI